MQRSDEESLTFHQQRARHLGRAELVLGATRVAALVRAAGVDDLKCVVPQNHHSVEIRETCLNRGEHCSGDSEVSENFSSSLN